MNWNLPVSVDINGVEYYIRNKCDYRVVLDVISALQDTEIDMQYRLECALFIFYGNDKLNTPELVFNELKDIEMAVKEMFKIISLGEEEQQTNKQPTVLMDWEHDFSIIAPSISRVLGYDVRTPACYCHYWTFIGAYMEIGESVFSTVVSIRSKRAKGKKLDKWEIEFLKEHPKMVELPKRLTEEERQLLNSDW